jgi:hypothetical protein
VYLWVDASSLPSTDRASPLTLCGESSSGRLTRAGTRTGRRCAPGADVLSSLWKALGLVYDTEPGGAALAELV